MKRLIFGIIYCVLWYMSILVGFFLFMCPLLPLVFLHPKLYRKCSETIFGMWEPFPVALMEIFFGTRAILTGDKIDPFERSLLIMNHRTRLDWNFLWVGLFHCCHPYSHALKYVLKSAVMHVPGPGWVMQTCSFLFIHRNWSRDQRLLERLLLYLDISDEPYQILIFPEGTDLTPSNILKSHKYADEHNLDRYFNVLHPKTTGFAYLAHKMKLSGKINAVYDITIAYPGQAPQNESELLKGNFPDEVHFHIKRYSARELPQSEPNLKTWLNGVWYRKEHLLSRFQQTNSFTHTGENYSNAEVDENNPDGDNGVQESISKVSVESTGNKSGSKISNGRQDMNVGNSRYDSEAADNIGPKNDLNNSNSYKLPSMNGGLVAGTVPRSLGGVDGTVANSNDESLRRGSTVCVHPYRPSHLLYLTFLFWIALIYFATHLFVVNCYVQLWVLFHALFFFSLSLLTDGFQHIIASIYFYRYNINTKRKDN